MLRHFRDKHPDRTCRAPKIETLNSLTKIRGKAWHEIQSHAMKGSFNVENFFNIKPPDKFTRFEKQVLDRLIAKKSIGKITEETLEE